MRKALFFVLCSFSFMLANGRSIDKTEALTLAKNYISGSSITQKSAMVASQYSLAYTAADDEQQRGTTQNHFYIYNIGDDEGFVIISADTRTKSVLGYSNSGHFETENMPENAKEWLNGYSEEIQYAIDSLPDVESKTYKALQALNQSAATEVVAPLLGSIAYDQDEPYNNNCPTYSGETCVTGCVATAMAQIMSYHRWPNTGNGSHSYTSRTHGFYKYANFSSSTYDWTNILTYYSGDETAAQKAAVALLMSDVGVSVEMDYDISSNGGSGAYSSDVPDALYSYFGYDAGVQIYYRDYFSDSEWESKVKSELDEGRPVYYAGQSTSGGHAFVCDGYDSNALFHFNWGWSGVSNGYFELSALNPNSQGIGSSNGGYNLSQKIVVGIKKAESGSEHSQIMVLDSIFPTALSINKAETVEIDIKGLFNLGAYENDHLDVRMALYNSAGEFERYLATISREKPLSSYSGWYTYPLNVNLSTCDNGSYTIRMVYRNEDDEYVPVLVSRGGIGAVSVEVTSRKVNFSLSSNTPSLSLSEKPAVVNQLYQNKTGQLSLAIENSGKGEYYAQVGVKLVSTSDAMLSQELVTSLTQIGAGEVKTLQLSGDVTVDPGTYYAYVYYDADNSSSTTTFPTTLLGQSGGVAIVTVEEEPTTASLLAIVGEPDMPSTVKQGESFSMTAKVLNTGAYYDDVIIAFVFSSTSKYSVSYFGYQTVFVDTDSTLSVSFDGAFSLDTGTYWTRIYCKDSSDWKKLTEDMCFTIEKSETAGISDVSEEADFSIVQNPVSDELNVTLPENAKTLMIFNLSGQMLKSYAIKGETSRVFSVRDLKSGVYVLALQTDEGGKTIKFIKE